MKKFAAILACVYLTAHLAACTSNESREDETISGTEETEMVDGELEKVEGADAAIAGDESNAGFVDEQLPEQALGEQPPADAGTAIVEETPAVDAGVDTGAPDALADSTAPSEPSFQPDALAETPAPAPEVAPAPAPDTSVAASESTTAVDPGTSVAASSGSFSTPSAPPAELQKVPTEPYRAGGQLLNAVYIARPGDSYKKIAKMIYGDEAKQKDLKKANSGRSVKPGAKIFYNSPQRPTDEVALKNYYEDVGMQPEIYVAQEGDNIRKVSKKLLGYDNAWKEIWTTNQGVESKSSLMAGTELRYWKGATAADSAPVTPPPVMANNDMAGANAPPADLPPPPSMPEQLPPAPDMAQMPPPPANDFPPPPDMNNNAAASGSMAMNDLPPPPPPEMAPPPPPPVEQVPPPPPVAKAPKPQMAEEGGMSNDDMMMALAGVGIVAAGIAAIMVIRKRRQQKEMQAAFGDTQIGAS